LKSVKLSTENLFGFYLAQNSGRQEEEACNIVKIRCADVQRHMVLVKIRVKFCMIVMRNQVVKGKLEHVVQSNRSGVAWLIKGIWKVRGLRCRTEGGTCPLWQGSVNVIHISQTCRDESKILWKKTHVK
jgi:hypothetical protein